MANINIMEVSNGYKVFRKGFNGFGDFEIWTDTKENALEVLKMILITEGSISE